MKISIFGAGAWGTAIALYCIKIGHRVTLVPKFEEQAQKMIDHRENVDFLPGITLPPELVISTDEMSAFEDIDVAFLACPAIGMEDLCRSLHDISYGMRNLPVIISLCKGIQNENLETASDLIERFLPNVEIGILAGPTNAREIAEGKKAAMVLATRSRKLYKIQEALNSEQIRIYSSDDVKGAELGGCLKNVYAIAAGICDGLRLGDNAKAAFLTRALKELVSIGTALGGKIETFYGLSGFGDFMATCTGAWSRNRTFGEKIGQGESITDVLSSQKTAVEGYRTTRSLFEICYRRGIDAPILDQIYAILFKKKPIKESVAALISRPLKPEK